jgi:hypothetical protein
MRSRENRSFVLRKKSRTDAVEKTQATGPRTRVESPFFKTDPPAIDLASRMPVMQPDHVFPSGTQK